MALLTTTCQPPKASVVAGVAWKEVKTSGVVTFFLHLAEAAIYSGKSNGTLSMLDLCPRITFFIQDLSKVQKWLSCHLDLPENRARTGTACHKRESAHFQSLN